MGEAIIAGLLSSGAVEPGAVAVAEPAAGRREALSAAHGVSCYAGAVEAISGAAIVVLAVKPQVIDTVLESIAPHTGDALVVSIAAGISCARLESALPAGTAVVRVMPNTPAMVGEGMAVVSGGTEASREQTTLVRELFDLLGRAVLIDEHLQNAATAISGSGPAYFALFIDALARAGVNQGLPRTVAEELAVQTMLGTARLIDTSGQHPEQIVDAVASPGGTTFAAIEALESGGLRSSVFAAVDAAVKRAKELGS